jgi:hypothetical protein
VIIDHNSSLADIAFCVCTALDEVKVTAVLTGGSAATIWSGEAYQSRDCDFVIAFYKHQAPANEALAKIGFEPRGQIYSNPNTIFTLDFPKGPLSIGEEIITKWETLRRNNDMLHILSATDSCRDRLAAFYFWNDFSSLKVAQFIAQRNPVDMDKIKKWSWAEGAGQKYEEFLRLLNHD